MATPNYGYEKRQRELAKKRKTEEKKQKKLQGGGTSPADDTAGEPAAGERSEAVDSSTVRTPPAAA